MQLYQILSKSPSCASEVTKQPCWFRPFITLLYQPQDSKTTADGKKLKRRRPTHSDEADSDDDGDGNDGDGGAATTATDTNQEVAGELERV